MKSAKESQKLALRIRHVGNNKKQQNLTPQLVTQNTRSPGQVSGPVSGLSIYLVTERRQQNAYNVL